MSVTPDSPRRAPGNRLRDGERSLEETGAELVARLWQHRDESTFEVIYRRYWHALCACARRVLNDEQMAQDAAQATFVALWHRSRTLKIAPRDLDAFLHRLARFKAIDRLRTERRHPVESMETKPGMEANPEASASGPDGDAALFWQTLRRRLTPAQYRTLVLRFGDGLSLRECATAEGITLRAAKNREHAALHKLRQRDVLRDFTYPFRSF